jgi:transcriptional regulator with XRE-family HTH domain
MVGETTWKEKTMSKLGELLRAERLKQGLTLGELARLVGYRNFAKGARRITCLEQTGSGTFDLLVNIAHALNLDRMVVERLAEEDHLERLREWEAWASEPVPMCMVIRLMAACYSRITLPADITTPELAEEWACKFARHHRFRVCLVVSRRISVWVDGSGRICARTEARPDHPNIPFMEVKGRRFVLEG